MFFKCVFNGVCQGQDVKNILYYRTGIGVDLGALGFSVAEDVANVVFENIWDPYMRDCMPNDYTMETLDVYPINDAFQLVYQNPFHHTVSQAGTDAQVHAGMTQCLNIQFSLEPTAIWENGIRPPKRGYVAIGPIAAAYVDEAGFVPNLYYSDPNWKFHQLAARLQMDLPFATSIGTNLYPIRVRTRKLNLDPLGMFDAYADINGASVQKRVSNRKSRRPE